MSKSYPKRVWINQPSSTKPLHNMHGKVGIAIKEKSGLVSIWFTEGTVRSMIIPENILSDKL